MPMTADQCRAGRGLLDWSQDDLATNARVSRATVADFERNLRTPMRNNLISMEECMFVAGVEFLPDDAPMGVGVRFRERKLQYSKNVRVADGGVILRLVWGDEVIECYLSRETLEDLNHTTATLEPDGLRKLASEMLHHILAAAERKLQPFGNSNLMTLTVADFPKAIV